MCILFIAVKQHPKFPLIIAANRDEFHARPTKPTHFWQDHPHILAGRDLSANGTWMGVNKSGDIAALTNIRAPGKERKNAISRGALVADFIKDSPQHADYLATLQNTHAQYNGYNLLFGNLQKLHVYNNFENTTYDLEKGVYGLSNASLNSPWPKLDAGRSALADYCQHADILNFEHLFELLRNNEPAHDDDLPDTGIPKDWEKMLSSIFIKSEEYGTRSSTILLIDNEQKVYWEERTFDANAHLTGTTVEEFSIESLPK
jgi:uncharacterized protein with NRDE domain